MLVGKLLSFRHSAGSDVLEGKYQHNHLRILVFIIKFIITVNQYDDVKK